MMMRFGIYEAQQEVKKKEVKIDNRDFAEIENTIRNLERQARETVRRVEAESGMVMNGTNTKHGGLFFSLRDLELG